MMWFLISKSFLQVATATGKVSKVVYHKKTMKQESVTKALLFREFKHFTSSPGYMLNSGLGIFLMPICAVALLWKGRKIFTMLNGMFGSQEGTVLLLVTTMLCGLTSMDIMTAPSISLEGKSLWIAQSLPVTPWQVLRAKLDMQLILNSMPVMLCMICTAVVCPFKIGQFVMMILQVLSYVFVMAVFGLFMGVIKPVLTWTNELTPIKQSASVMITMFGGFGYTALLFMYGIDMEKEQYSKLISDIPEPDIAISMGCNVGCPFIGRLFDDNWGLDDPTGKSDEDFIKVINQIELKIKNMIDRMK